MPRRCKLSICSAAGGIRWMYGCCCSPARRCWAHSACTAARLGDWRKMHKSGCRHFSSLHSGQRRILSARHGGPPESLPVGQRDLLQSAGAAGIQLCGRRLYRCRLDHLQDMVQRLRAAGHQSAGGAVLHVHAAHGQHVCAALRAADPVARLLQCMASSDSAAPKLQPKAPVLFTALSMAFVLLLPLLHIALYRGMPDLLGVAFAFMLLALGVGYDFSQPAPRGLCRWRPLRVCSC